MKDSGTERVRAKALKRLRELAATSWVVSPPDQEEMRRVSTYKDTIAVATKKELYRIIDGFEAKIAEIRRGYEIIAPPEHLMDLLDVMEAAPPGRSTLVPLHVWATFFRNGKHPFRGMDVWPPHARLALDATGRVYAHSRHPEVHLLEAIMFEDMAALFNLAAQTYHGEATAPISKSVTKRRNALCRATTTAAVYFVEAFVNGLAAEHVLTNAGTLDPNHKSALLDWDFGRNRPRYLSLRDKILQYQRIILKVPHPPVQESNCSEMRDILETAKLVRDAVAHPSPTRDRDSLDQDKERAILSVTLEQATMAADASVGLVRKLDQAIRGDSRRLFWLYQRGDDGLFPDAAFA